MQTYIYKHCTARLSKVGDNKLVHLWAWDLGLKRLLRGWASLLLFQGWPRVFLYLCILELVYLWTGEYMHILPLLPLLVFVFVYLWKGYCVHLLPRCASPSPSFSPRVGLSASASAGFCLTERSSRPRDPPLVEDGIAPPVTEDLCKEEGCGSDDTGVGNDTGWYWAELFQRLVGRDTLSPPL